MYHFVNGHLLFIIMHLFCMGTLRYAYVDVCFTGFCYMRLEFHSCFSFRQDGVLGCSNYLYYLTDAGVWTCLEGKTRACIGVKKIIDAHLPYTW